MERLTQIVHNLIGEVLKPDDVAVDATMGNGYDTVFLAKLCKNVFAFDIQQQAIDATRKKIEQAYLQAKLILDGHENVDKYVTAKVKAAVFNLGYLPRSDKSIITLPYTTVLALQKLTEMLEPKGRICVTIYRGHLGGHEESETVQNWISSLNEKEWHVLKFLSNHEYATAPILFCLEKI